ncbi:MAG TPA: response regulator [Tepidisphaeraceae bacterium]|nr:response regulator [Tepidisphaeraceae bacterium]
MNPHPISTLRILIVEDDKGTRCAMTRLLERHGYGATASGTVADTLELLLRQTFDVALVDLMLPDGHGGEIVDWLTLHAPQTAVTVLTGCNDATLLQAIRASGGVRLLQKPIEFVEVLANIRKTG